MMRFEDLILMTTAMQYVRIFEPRGTEKHHKVLISLYSTDIELTGVQADRFVARINATWPEATRQPTNPDLIVPETPFTIITGGKR